MKIVSLNIGKRRQQPWRNGTDTAIHKESVEESLLLTKTGLQGDEQADSKNHGGEDKAVLVLPSNAYIRFEVSQPYGFLGENVTIDDIDEAEICLGDRLQIGSVLLEVTQPRSPCWKLDALAVDNTEWQAGEFLQAYSDSGRVGFYCRVLGTGSLQKGQSIRWLTRNEEAVNYDKKFPRITIQELFLAQLKRASNKDWRIISEAVKHPALSKSWQKSLLGLLDRRSQK